MVETILTNVHTDIFCIGKCGIFESNYSQSLYLSSGFSISGSPNFVVALRMKKVKENGIVGSRRRNCGAINGLLKGGSGNALVDGVIIEKEFEFKPSFDDYLKAMESVRGGKRGKQMRLSKENELRNDSKRKGAGRITPAGDEDVKLEEFEGKLSRAKPKSGGFSTKKAQKSDEINCKDRDSKRLKDTMKKGFEEKADVRSAWDLAQDELDGEESGTAVNAGRKLEMDKENVRRMNKKTSSELGIEANDKLIQNNFKKEKHGLIDTEISWRPWNDNTIGGKAFNRKIALKNVKSSWTKKLIPEETSDNYLTQERAAFKSLEEYDDVYDKPRVSRADMEERIQTLAKCLNGADINMPEWMFSKIMRSAKIRFSDHSMIRLIQILGKLGNWRRVVEVIEWIQLRERFKSHRIRHIYTAALDALGKAKRPVEALNIFYAMQQHMSSYPDLVAYHCIAVTLGQAGHMKELFDVIDSMQSPPKKKFKTRVPEKWDPRLEPDIVIYNAVLNACVRRRKWEGAFWVLQQLKQKGQQPSSATYGLVMEVMFACGKYDLVHDFFKKVQKSSIPNALTYKVVVNTLWREGKTDEAVLAVQDMERRGIVGSAGLYYDLARCLCGAGRCKEALMQIDKICKVANQPLVVTYTGLMQACLDSGNIQNGAYIFNHMHKHCLPNLVTCNIMLKAYLDYSMFGEAKELFLKLLENANHITSKSDYRNMVIPDIYTFNLMLDACIVEQRWDDLEFIYTRMLEYGHHFNAKRHLRVVLSAYRAGKKELLETTCKHLTRTDRIPPPLLIKEMFHMKLEQDNCAAALSCFTNIPLVESQLFSQKSWSGFFMENARCFQKDTLVRLVREASILVARSNSPNLIIQNLITSCREFLTR